MTTSRRGFLGWLGSASLAGAFGTPSTARASGAPPRNDSLADEHALAVSETWDMSWTSRVTGKYKAVFDSPDASDGAALYRAVSWIEQYTCILQPNGVFAALRAQEAGCSYINAS